MLWARWVVVALGIVPCMLMAADGVAKTLSREEVDALWEELLKNGEYKAISYWSSNPDSTPAIHDLIDDKEIIVKESREGLLWGFFGLSNGGGWEIKGRLEAEIARGVDLLQLYSKAISKWSPGFAFFWMPGYNREEYPIWEFRLIRRDSLSQQAIQTLKSIPVPPKEVIKGIRSARKGDKGETVQYIYPPGEEACPVGQRCPRGELSYDSKGKKAIIRILGVYHPFTVEVPLLQAFERDERERK